MRIINRTVLLAALIMACGNVVCATDDPFGGLGGGAGDDGREKRARVSAKNNGVRAGIPVTEDNVAEAPAGAGGSGSHEILVEELPAYFPGGKTLQSLPKTTQDEIKEKALEYLAAEKSTNRHSLACHRVAERLMIEYQSLSLRIDRERILLSFTQEQLDKVLDKAKTVKKYPFPRKRIELFSKEQQKEFLQYAMEYISQHNKTLNKMIPYSEAARQLILKHKDMHLSLDRDVLSRMLKKNPEYAAKIQALKSDLTRSVGAGGGASGAAASLSAAASLDVRHVRQVFVNSLSPDLQAIVGEVVNHPTENKLRLDHLRGIGKPKLEALLPLLKPDMAEHHYSIISTFADVPEYLMDEAVRHVQKQLKSKRSYATIKDALAEFLEENESAGSSKRARAKE